jgi:pilus assembly protein Flp/PilA
MNLRVIRNRSGATAIEYGLLAALISIAAVIAIELTGVNLTALFGGIGNSLQSVGSGNSPTQSASSSPCSFSTDPTGFCTFESVSTADLIAPPNSPPCGSDFTPKTISVLEAPNGTVVDTGGCIGASSESALVSRLQKSGSGEFTFFNPSGGSVAVPDIDGPGTGLTLPAGDVAVITPGTPFFIEGQTPLTASLISTLTATCAALGGDFADDFGEPMDDAECDNFSSPGVSSTFGLSLISGGT